MNEPIDELERLRHDWQADRAQPHVSVAELRKRLARRWLVALAEGLGMLGIAGLLIFMALNIQGLMNWIYWGFFAAYFVVIGGLGMRERFRLLQPRSDSTAAILDHAWRDARARRKAGATLLWISPLVWAFATLWMLADGWLGKLAQGALLKVYGPSLVFVSVFCLLTACFGAWMREKGRCQLTEIKWLAEELEVAVDRGQSVL